MTHTHPVLNQQKKISKKAASVVVKPEQSKVASAQVLKSLPFELDVTAIVVNFETLPLIIKAVSTFRKFYPRVPLMIIDNHSSDGSREWIREQKNDFTKVVLNRSNKGHGPALHSGITRAETRFVFTFDSDVEFLKGGFLEALQERIQDAYAVGWLRWVNKDGVAVDERNPFDKTKYCPYIHPYSALYNRDIYLTLPPFVNNGAPAVFNMRAAQARDLEVKPFFLDPYVKHLIAGTRRMWRGHWYPNDKPKMVDWVAESHYPI